MTVTSDAADRMPDSKGDGVDERGGSSEAVLRLEGVVKSYRQGDGTRLPVLDVPSFEVARAEQLAIVGRSGCGKTTLLHLIAGIAQADRGAIWLDGINIAALSEAARDRMRAATVGYVFQTFNLLPAFTAWENVVLGMTFAKRKRRGSAWARARELLEQVGLGHRLHHRPPQLSVGEQQRVAVARALANHPPLVLADEPTANVDPANQQAIVSLIRSVCAEHGAALVVVTHAMEVARQFERVERLESLNRVLQDAPSAASGVS